MNHDNRPEQVLQNEIRGGLDEINSATSTQAVTDNSSLDDEKVSYEEWLEFATDYDWWDDIIEYECEELEKKGILIYPNTIHFDLYHGSISSSGSIADETFLTHHPEILQQSPVAYQILLEGWANIPSWRPTGRGLSINFNSWIEYWDDDSEFTSGLLAGCNIQELVDADPIPLEDVMETIYRIVEAEHERILKLLEQEYEYLTSEEAYQAWLECQF